MHLYCIKLDEALLAVFFPLGCSNTWRITYNIIHCSMAGYLFIFLRQVFDFFGGSWFYAFLFLLIPVSLIFCLSASLLFCFSAFLLFLLSAFLLLCFSCFSAFLLLCFSCFSAFLLLCFCFPFFSACPASLLLCFLLFLLLCFSASLFSLLLCFCTFVPFYFYYSTFSFLHSCLFAALLPAPLLLCFLSLLHLCFSLSFDLFCCVCILNETLERP